MKGFLIDMNSDFGILTITASGYLGTAELIRDNIKDGIKFCLSYSGPYIVNMIFACELYLKALLCHDKIDYKKIHKLDELFELLPEEYKQEITNSYNSKVTNGISLNEFTQKHANAFVEKRYPNESCNQESLLFENATAFANALDELTVLMFNKETKENAD